MKNIIIIIVLALLASCSSVNENNNKSNSWEHKVLIKEVIQTSAYTYLLVDENGLDRWIAVSRMDANVNDVYYYNSGLEMIDFKSKELDRTFSNLLLVQVISDGKTKMPVRQMQQSVQSEPLHLEKTKSLRNVENVGIVSLTELFANPNNYNGKKITVSGEVVKFNPRIMGRNWLHIVDGNSNYDLTITTNDGVNVGDNVTFEGIITLNKDFGAGYKYAIIMEEGVLK